MAIHLPLETRISLENHFATLKTPYRWRAVTSFFKDEVPPHDYTSNVHVVPFIGDRAVLLHAKESGWGPSGGTLLEGEAFETCVTRELGEEIGGVATRVELFGQWDSETTAEVAYRPWLPHPKFAIALGWADVTITGSSDDDGGVEMESILEVSVLPIRSAVQRLEENGEQHLAALYSVAHEVRRAAKG